MHLLIFQSQQGMRLTEEAGIEISDMGFPKFRNAGIDVCPVPHPANIT